MTAPNDTRRIRFLTQNIWTTKGNWPARQGGLIATIAHVDPDVLVLQEVARTEAVDQLAALDLDQLPYRVHQAEHAPADVPGVRSFGLAIAARWPFQVVGCEDLRVRPDAADGPWGALAVRFDFGPTLGDLLVIAAKPSWQLDREAVREEQALRLARLARRHRGRMASVMLGDFDATPQAASMRFLTGLQGLHGESTRFVDAWDALHPGAPGYTWTTDNPTAVPEIAKFIGPGAHHRRLDYVLVGSFDPARSVDCEILSCDVVTGAGATPLPPSDHYGVVADIEYRSRPPAG